MKLGTVVMLRNESPIIDCFLDQIEEFFDYAVFIDHSSTDRTVAAIKARSNFKSAIYKLTSSGYPQSEVTTFFTKKIFDETDLEYVMPLDCDEFLPFKSKNDLISFIKSKGYADVIRLPWLNLSPEFFDSIDIFSCSFYHGKVSSEFYKTIISNSVIEKCPSFSVHQGSHDISVADGIVLSRVDEQDIPLLHIPVQSSVQFGFKLANGHARLTAEKTNLSKNQGSHWVSLALDYSLGRLSSDKLRNLAVSYPYIDNNIEADDIRKLDFNFPYIKSEYRENSSYYSSQISALINLRNTFCEISGSGAFSVQNDAGDLILTYKGNEAFMKKYTISAETESREKNSLNFKSAYPENLIEPLFSLPTKLPVTAWKGHIPFMFVLMKLLNPAVYVELGVHNGASLIAAATAAKSYNLKSRLFGIDAWEGDEHAGIYDGNPILADLQKHISDNFSNVELIKSYFSDAVSGFYDSSIELLHIDGLHTYDAVKEDFETWLPKMSGDGIILFHDTCVYERGFGVHKLWAELSQVYTTIEFPHSYGLGVLFLNPNDMRIRALSKFASNPDSFHFYKHIVSLVSETLPERMSNLESGRQLQLLQAEINDLLAQVEVANSEIVQLQTSLIQQRSVVNALKLSTSWRITSPLRRLSGFFK